MQSPSSMTRLFCRLCNQPLSGDWETRGCSNPSCSNYRRPLSETDVCWAAPENSLKRVEPLNIDFRGEEMS